MLKIVYSGLLAGLLLFVYSDAFSQEPVPDRGKEIWMGAGLSRASGFAYSRITYQPRILYKVAKGKWYRRYSLIFNHNVNSTSESYFSNEIPVDRLTRRGRTNASFGLGAERRIPLGKRTFFYIGGEVALLVSQETEKRYMESDLVSPLTAQISDSRVTQISPGLALNSFAGFHCNLLPKMAISIEAGPGANLTGNFFHYKSTLTAAPGTISEEINESKRGSFTWSTGLRLLVPVFIQAGYRF
jgi:hypothetical protein